MYTPRSFAEPDPAALREAIGRHGFAILTTQGEHGLLASHLPLRLDDGPGTGPHGHLVGHMARANPQWRDVRGEALAVFSGPHAYISPSWYEAAGTVPTWNYVAVHAYGAFRIVEDRDEVLAILRGSVSAYESARPEPWTFDEAAPGVDALLGAIVGFRVEISRLEGTWKLSQNHPEERRRKVIRGLEASPSDDARAVADLMRAALGPPPP